MKKEKEIIKNLLAGADITINGSNAYDPQIHNEDLYHRVLRQGSLGLGESYMDGWWGCERLDEFFHKILKAELDNKIKKNWSILLKIAWNSVLNRGRKSKAFEIGEKHYDIGNDLYREMLDKRLTYTGGYWKNVDNLDEAQEAKLDLVCKKIGLKRGQKILDIGSGWGSFIGYAAEKYGADALGITVSKEQKELADELYKNFSKDGGLFLLHTIGSNISAKENDLWITKYIFPVGMLPSIKQIGKSIEGLFVMEDWHSFGADYDKTLMAWHKNFEDNWDKIKTNYNERFYRMWKYYLLSCAGSFRARKNQLWQIVLSKKGTPGGYKSVR